MKLWMRKVSVFIIAVLTLGMYVPTAYLDVNAESDEVVSENSKTDEDISLSELQSSKEEDLDESYIDIMTEKAKEQVTNKLGPRIISRVEDDFTDTILPAIEEVVQSIFTEVDEDEIRYFEISEQHATDYGEKIFTIYDHQSKQEIARFDVRRDLRPGEGYWFNFHYHLSKDKFQEHHYIGEIYWDKNTPPKWMKQ